MIKCNEQGFGHVWEAASDNHPNILEGKMYQPWGSHCICKEKIPWTGSHPQDDGLEEMKISLKRSMDDIKHIVSKML